MKTIIRILFAVTLLFVGVYSASAQGVESPTLTFSVVTNGYTTAETVVMDVRKQENVAVALVFSQSNATNVIPITVTFKKSVDGVNASDADTVSWSYIRAAVATSQVATTNISVAGYPYLILKSIAAPGGDANLLTVSSFKYFVKHMSER
jgi:hypothetical protein